jgi:hypothetical protein
MSLFVVLVLYHNFSTHAHTLCRFFCCSIIISKFNVLCHVNVNFLDYVLTAVKFIISYRDIYCFIISFLC